MIRYIKIQNFSLIKDLEIHFDSKLNVIYGESGSGKSLILHCLSILTGSNSSVSLIREGETKALLECEIDDIGTIQKVISKSKTTQSIDGELVTIAILKQKIGSLVENFSQGEQEEIYTKQYQNSFVDQFCSKEIEEVKSAYKEWKEYRDKLENLLETIDQKRERRNMYEFYLKEIEQVSPIENEEDNLNEKLKDVLMADTYKTTASEIFNLVTSAQSSIQKITSLCNKTKFKLDKIFELESIMEDVNKEVSDTLDKYLSNDLELSVDDMNARIYELQKLKKKLGKKTVNEVIEYKNQIESDLLEVDQFEDSVKSLEDQVDIYAKKYEEKDALLKIVRTDQSKRLSDSLQKELKGVGFTYVEIEPKINSRSEYNFHGTSEVEFLVSFNKGFAPKSMSKIVSGGEASRLALCMKLLSNTDDTILILDEVDTGLSGNTVKSLANKLKQIPNQIICVTHSQEIISEADKKIKIYKEEVNSKTETKVEES